MTLRWIVPDAVGRLLRSEDAGAVDLPALVVGTAVAGILAGGAAVSASAAIPYAQDAAARQDASQVATAEGLSRVLNGRYASADALAEAGLLLPRRGPAGPAYAAEAGPSGSCFVVVTRSATGALFYATDQTAAPEPLGPGTDTGCLPAGRAQGMAATLHPGS